MSTIGSPKKDDKGKTAKGGTLFKTKAHDKQRETLQKQAQTKIQSKTKKTETSYVAGASDQKNDESAIYQKVKLLAQKNIGEFFARWKEIDVTSIVVTPTTVRDVHLYCYGCLFIMKTMQKSRWVSALFSHNAQTISGITNIYNYVLNQMTSEIPTQMRPKCYYLEKNLLSLCKYLFGLIPPVRVLRDDVKLLYFITMSMCSDNITNRLESMIIIKSILRDSKTHHTFLLQLKKIAKELELENPLKFLMNHYSKINENDPHNKLIMAIIGKIYASNSASPHLPYFIKLFESAGLDLSAYEEERKAALNKNDLSYWKEKFFAAQNELEELQAQKDQAQQLSEQSYLTSKESQELKAENLALGRKINDMSDIIKQFMVLLHEMREKLKKSAFANSAESKEIQAKIDQLEKYNDNLTKIINQKMEEIEIDETIAKGLDELEKEKEKEEIDLDEKDKDETNDVKPEDIIDSFESELGDASIVFSSDAPPPPPPPPPMSGPMDPAAALEKERQSLIRKFEKYLGVSVISLIFKIMEDHDIHKRLPFLNFNILKEGSKGLNFFTDIPNDIASMDKVNQYLLQFLKLPVAEKKFGKVATEKVTVVSDQYLNHLKIVLKKINMPAVSIVDAITNFDVEKMNVDQVEMLQTTYPKPDDLQKLLSASKSNKLVDEAEIFAFNIWSKSYARSLISFMQFKLTFQERFDFINMNLNRVYNGVAKIQTENILKKLFHGALFIGNVTQIFKKKDPIEAFSLERFSDVLDTKANDRTNLMKFIVKTCYNIEEDVNECQALADTLELAANVSISAIKAEIDLSYKKIEDIENIISSNENLEQYRDFHKGCLETICNIQEKFSDMNQIIAKVRSHYCVSKAFETEKFILYYKDVAVKAKKAMLDIQAEVAAAEASDKK